MNEKDFRIDSALNGQIEIAKTANDLEVKLNSALSQLTEADSRLAEKDKEIARLRDVLTVAKDELNDLWSYCGKGLEVHGWHLNGNPEPLDNFFEDNSCGAREAIEEALSTVSTLPYIHTDKVKPLVANLRSLASLLVCRALSKYDEEEIARAFQCIAQYKETTGE